MSMARQIIRLNDNIINQTREHLQSSLNDVWYGLAEFRLNAAEQHGIIITDMIEQAIKEYELNLIREDLYYLFNTGLGIMCYNS